MDFGKAFILMSASGASGAEKRFARAFIHLNQTDNNYHFIVNQSLYQDLIQQGIRLDNCRNVKILPHFSWLPMNHSLYRKLYLFIYPWMCMRYIINKKIKLVHLVANGVYIGLPFLFNKKIGVAVSVVDPGLDTTISRVGYPLYKFILKNSDAIDLLSEDIKTRLIRSEYNAHNCLNSKLFVTPCSFIDYEKAHPSEKKKDWIVFLGRLDPMKNPLLFVESIPYILRRYPKLEFYVLGRGPQEKEVKQMIDKLNLGHKVKLLFTENPQNYLAQSKIFLSLQTFNNYPSQSLIEAMACENTIVATDVGETWKLIDNTTGLRVAGDPQAVAQAVCTLLDNPDRQKELARNARQKVLNEHSIDRFTTYLQDLHNSVYHM